MKKNFVLVSTILAILMVTGCASTNKSTPATLNTGRVEILDYQGRVFEEKIPDWVKKFSDKKALMKTLDLSEKEFMVWNFTTDGKDKDFIEQWTDKVELQSNVSQSISTEIGRATQASLDAEQTMDSATKEKTLKDVTSVLSNVRVNGLERKASFWALYRRSLKTKPQSDADYDTFYTYYSVWTMPKELYQTQLEAAAKDPERNTSQDPILQAILTKSIAETMLGNADLTPISLSVDNSGKATVTDASEIYAANEQ